MAAQIEQPTAELPPEFDLDITSIELGGAVDDILRMTDDNCGQTCESACTSCP
ncbi:hypothetical protein GCM10012275_54330 [Longimycelium tulufanense]|uniref:FxLD family lantipeptide n=1 Tax=Longimycelium tulufanense TaxID=907463 RepID=A0A8J3CJM0_9PSEU|nr:FxLD family lanthipeptide [Longimycelium tulufanense]GGM76776.1 hypothetical protein GCM10012275_54330 [Longimycelium tulufanense]